MKKRKIKFSLVYRDMWQSAGKYMPHKEQLERIAPAIIDMGCFDRIETNGGGFEQINLLFGENPNESVRAWCKPFNEAGIETHMLERGLNGIRMRPVPADIRKLMFQVKKKQGVNISRSFDGLNDENNIIDSVKYAKEAGMVAQGTLCITYSKVHTVDYYVSLADDLIKGGSEEICLKDMAGIGRPVSLGKIVEGIKKKHPDIPIQYHGQTGPGFTVASILEVVNAGCEYIDVGMEPLSWGTGHADLLTILAMLEDAGYEVPDVNMKAYMEARRLSQEFIDEFLGYYIDPYNRQLNALLIKPGLPGGMMGSLMADLANNLKSINKYLEKKKKPLLTQDELMLKLYDEVEYIWPKMGYPPLVTPYSQYVKNVALMNVTQMLKGKERFTIIDDNTWDMLLGKSGKLPGKLAPELEEKAKAEGREFYEGNPQDLYPDELDTFKKEMDEKGWDYGQDNEELFELAMHPEQYRNYKSGEAKKAFEEDLAKRKSEGGGLFPAPAVEAPKAEPAAPVQPSTMNIDVNGEKFKVTVSYGDEGGQSKAENKPETSASAPAKEEKEPESKEGAEEVTSPIEGNFYLTKEASEKPLKVGDTVKKGDILGYIEAMKTYNSIKSDKEGTIVEIVPDNGEEVIEDDVLFLIK